MVKPDGHNHPQSWSICPVKCPALNKTPEQENDVTQSVKIPVNDK